MPHSADEVVTLRGRMGDVSSVTFSPDGRLLAAGSMDGGIRVWDAKLWKAHPPPRQDPLFTLHQTSSVLSVSFGPDSRRLAAGYDDHLVRVWDTSTQAREPDLARSCGCGLRRNFQPGRLAAGYRRQRPDRQDLGRDHGSRNARPAPSWGHERWGCEHCLQSRRPVVGLRLSRPGGPDLGHDERLGGPDLARSHQPGQPSRVQCRQPVLGLRRYGSNHQDLGPGDGRPAPHSGRIQVPCVGRGICSEPSVVGMQQWRGNDGDGPGLGPRRARGGACSAPAQRRFRSGTILRGRVQPRWPVARGRLRRRNGAGLGHGRRIGGAHVTRPHGPCRERGIFPRRAGASPPPATTRQ